MGVPKRKRSHSRQHSRMANKHVATPTLIECPNASCEALIQPHTACPRCGYYQGREVIEINTERRERMENA